jgi:flagellar basal body-associated protein FliL
MTAHQSSIDPPSNSFNLLLWIPIIAGVVVLLACIGAIACVLKSRANSSSSSSSSLSLSSSTTDTQLQSPRTDEYGRAPPLADDNDDNTIALTTSTSRYEPVPVSLYDEQNYSPVPVDVDPQ